MDGFVPRRASRNTDIGSGIDDVPDGFRTVQERPQLGQAKESISANAAATQPKNSAVKSEIDASLAGIDDEPEKKRRWPFRRKRVAKVQSKRRKIIKRVAIGIGVILLLIGIFIGIRALIAGGNVFKGNLLGLFTSQPLKMDDRGRSNIVVFGTSEDDPGHEGALLTDSIMLISVDQKKNNAYLLSIPRDLWVDYGTACNSGYSGRINEVYSCFSGDGEKEAAGAKELAKKVGEVTDMEVQYYVHMNYGVLVDAVDAVGGVSVEIDSDDPRGIFDDNFDWRCQYRCNFVKYKNGPTGLMDGEHALALARARGASGNTYGLPGANFDREKYQRKILVALKDRAASAGTLTNPGKVTALIDAMGKNLRTNFETGEVRTLMRLGTDVPSKEIRSLNLNDPEAPLVVGSMINGASVLIPSAGQGNFSDIQAYVHKNVYSTAASREEAPIVVLNGTTTIGLAEEEATKLEKKGFTVSSYDNAPTDTYIGYTVYRIKKGYPATKTALEKLYGVTVKTKAPAFTVAPDTAFVVVVGAQPAE